MGFSISLSSSFLLIMTMATVSTTATASTTKTITVDKNGTHDRELCCEDTTPCGVLSFALDCATETDHSVRVVIHEGDYKLNRNKSYVFENKNEVEIMGIGSEVLITCEPDIGIAFNRSENLSISGLTLINCGVRQLSTSRNFTSGELQYFKVALYFVFCSNVNIHNVNITNSIGMAAAFLNTNGAVEISNSQFQNGREDDITAPGGGGLYIEFFVCCEKQWAQYTCSENESIFSRNAKYTIANSNFSNNAASPGSVQTTHIQRDEHFAFGRGGGLATYLREKTDNITLLIEGNCFDNNTAEIGAGFVILLFGSNNVVKLNNNSITKNSCTDQGIPPSLYSTGGGAAIALRAGYYGNNKVTISNSNFTGNTAFWGGGMTIDVLTVNISNSTHSGGLNKLLIEDCRFESNRARIGSAVEMTCGEPNYAHGICSAIPIFKNCNFSKNHEKYRYAETENNSTGGYKGRTFATFHSLYLPVDFEGQVIFEENSASGLGLQECNARVQSNAIVKFINNVGKIGGGAALIGKSTIFLLNNTELHFIGNTATEKGGAIYASQSQEQFAAYSHTCFITYTDTQNHPDRWNTTVTLSGNKASQGSAIYASSIFPCVYASNVTSKLDDDINDTFCDWSTWHFDEEDEECSKQIYTEPCKFENRMYTVSLYPGMLQKLENFTVWDDLHHDVTKNTLFTTCPSNFSQQENNRLLVTPSGISANGLVGMRGTFELQTADSRSVYSSLHIDLFHCPPGFTNDNQSGCNCNPTAFNGNLVCNASSPSSILVGFCISYDNYTEKLILTRCPFFAAELAQGVTKLPLNVMELDQVCSRVHRTGKLCGQCIDGRGVDVFSLIYQCIEFKETFWKWLEAFAVTLLPLTIFFVIAVVFHVSMTSASTNGYLFFSHVMTTQLQVLVIRSGWSIILYQQNSDTDAEKIISKIMLVPYSIWNFDFFRIFSSSVSLHQSLRIMDVLALNYVTALYPILLIIVAYVIIELHARNCRVIVSLWRPLCFLCVRFRRNWELRTSVIDAFATFTLLSYSKVIGVSFLLLTPSPIILEDGTKINKTLNFDPNVEFFKHEHWPFGLSAALILLVCAAIPILLILYPFQWFQRMLNTLKLNRPGLQIFVCAFQGCFKDGTNGNPDRRYFAGIYFLMRIIVFLTYTLADDLVIMYSWLQVIYVLFLLLLLILQPYKVSYYNYLDGFFLAILAISSGSSVYMIARLYTTRELSARAWYPTMIILVIPSIYGIGHLTVWICIRSRCLKQCVDRLKSRGDTIEEEYQDPFEDEYTSITSTSSTRLLRSMSDTADRVENPQRYNQQRSGDRDSGLSLLWAASVSLGENSSRQQAEHGAATY